MPAPTLEQFPDHLSRITQDEWNELFNFIPALRTPGTDYDLIDAFSRKAYDMQLIINFDWSEWMEGRYLLRGLRDDYDDLDTVTLCKMLTVVMRQSRFVDGLLEGCIANGIIPGILEGLQMQVSPPDPSTRS